ncbi:MAG TPA: chloride channel protein, partial [Xanthobacteraceae bacterium]|nr:chloride channel protein [Xanthobacteraceae bacterium]
MAIAALFSHIEVPRRLRALVRARETSLVVLAIIVGVVSGAVVLAMSATVDALHALFFGLPFGTRLSSVIEIKPPVLAVAVPCVGGLLFGLAAMALARWRSGREVDPIEANALHGGRMSVVGSIIVAAQTVWSSGVGASVGLEAGYTQLASGLASRLGGAFRLRRRDLRVLVGCGAAAGIAGAFGAPLGGAFYAFELVIGSYSITGLAPVGAAALIGYLVVSHFERVDLGMTANMEVGTPDLFIAALLGVLAAGFGIAIMRSVGYCEVLLQRLRVPLALRPALGGVVVGLLAIESPQVMSSGHGALHVTAMLGMSLAMIALVFALKAVASVASLGSGFRGGLFFASLLLGALGGQLVCAGLEMVLPGLPLNRQVYAIIGMGALSVSIIGGPLTMTFIALESTGDLWLSAAVLIAVIISAQVTREAFGYS